MSHTRSAIPVSRRELMMSRLVVRVVAAQMKLFRNEYILAEGMWGMGGTYKTITKIRDIGARMAMTVLAIRRAGETRKIHRE